MSIRTSSADKDPYKEDVHCFLNQHQNLQILMHYVEYKSPENYHTLTNFTSPYINGMQVQTRQNKGYFHFTLGYDIGWPLNIIISLKTMLRYQILFRNIFQAKLIERMLSQCWKSHQDLKDLESVRLLKPGYGILQRMIHFVKNYIYFLCHEVVEIKWLKFIKNMETVSISEIFRLIEFI
jgi:Gamma tubulin complex component C-terminal